ncbi:unnamed protein product [Linum trigynum]|uniref:Uncharacterized protein n=1 Tax=Linum trigynum TaxID=586398 RepID=A0AAV2GSQ6_9ROSI
MGKDDEYDEQKTIAPYLGILDPLGNGKATEVTPGNEVCIESVSTLLRPNLNENRLNDEGGCVGCKGYGNGSFTVEASGFGSLLRCNSIVLLLISLQICLVLWKR